MYETQKCKHQNGKTYRFTTTDDGRIFVFAPHKKRYGKYYTKKEFDTIFTVIQSISENDKWHNRLKNAVKALEKSGLWSDILTTYLNLLNVNLNDKEELKKTYYDDSISETDKQSIYRKYEKKYPFMFKEHNGQLILQTEYTDDLSDCHTKSMYFGKYDNKSVKENIEKAIQNKTAYKHHCRTTYDVNFEYSPNLNKAWYSEEFKNCGNGHYYLAIGNSSAIFYEDD